MYLLINLVCSCQQDNANQAQKCTQDFTYNNKGLRSTDTCYMTCLQAGTGAAISEVDVTVIGGGKESLPVEIGLRMTKVPIAMSTGAVEAYSRAWVRDVW